MPTLLSQNQELDLSYLLFILIFGYALRVAYIKYIKPKMEKGETPKLSFNLKSIAQHLEAISRLVMSSIAIYIGVMTVTAVQSMPETTVEVPAKLVLLLISFLMLYTLIMTMYLTKSLLQ